ncbi:MAG: hypothetical protein E7556_03315 [Ruminococcaceae bacterium]|nr:hypothetical protein [Oscillospiraceae bacterium]
MKLEVLKCPDCGANIEFEAGSASCECEYCGAIVTIAATQGIKNTTPNVLKNVSQQQNKAPGLGLTNNNPNQNNLFKSFLKKLFNGLFIFNLFFAGFGFIMAIADSDILSVFIAFFFLIYAALFRVLALTPKGSKHILGKEKGLKTVYFVLICIFLSFAVIMLSPTSDEDTADTGNTTTITEQVSVTE